MVNKLAGSARCPLYSADIEACDAREVELGMKSRNQSARLDDGHDDASDDDVDDYERSVVHLSDHCNSSRDLATRARKRG